MMNDSEKNAKATAEQVKEMGREKQALIKKIDELKANIAITENQIKKDDDELQGYKAQK